jgi:hypothetical protein
MSTKPLYFCQNCNALYQIVKVEAGPESVSPGIICLECRAPFQERDGKFILKYFMLRTAARKQKWKRA